MSLIRKLALIPGSFLYFFGIAGGIMYFFVWLDHQIRGGIFAEHFTFQDLVWNEGVALLCIIIATVLFLVGGIVIHIRIITLLLRIIGALFVLFGILGIVTSFGYSGMKFAYSAALAITLLVLGGLMETKIPRYFAQIMYNLYLKLYPPFTDENKKLNDEEYYKIRGDFFLKSIKEYKIAIEEYSKAIELAPNRSELYKQRALAFISEARWISHIPIVNEETPELMVKACDDINTAIEKKPQDQESFDFGFEICGSERGWYLLGIAQMNEINILPISLSILLQKTSNNFPQKEMQKWLESSSNNRFDIEYLLKSLIKLNNPQLNSILRKGLPLMKTNSADQMLIDLDN